MSGPPAPIEALIELMARLPERDRWYVALVWLAACALWLTLPASAAIVGELPPVDSVMTARMKAAGCIVVGKTNIPEFGLGSHSFNDLFGTTRNAWDPAVTAGRLGTGTAAWAFITPCHWRLATDHFLMDDPDLLQIEEQESKELMGAMAGFFAEDGITLHHLDIGGGVGIRYRDETPPNLNRYAQAVREKLADRKLKVLMEPGRSLVGNAGVLLTEALVLKPGRVDDGGKNFCIVDAAMNDMARPAMYQAWQDIVPCHLRADAPQTWDVVGPVCESGDWLGRDRALAVQPGDVLAVLSAGAYGMAMASNYNTRPRAAEVMVDNGRATLIRRRETVADLFRDELLPG